MAKKREKEWLRNKNYLLKEGNQSIVILLDILPIPNISSQLKRFLYNLAFHSYQFPFFNFASKIQISILSC